MKKNKLVNVILIMIVGLSILLAAKETLAADVIDITNSITGNSSVGNNTVGNNTTGGNNSISGNNTTTGNNTTSGNNTVLTTNNTSNTSEYNNSSLPKTGIEDSISGIVLVVILGISAVYAYNKIQYYKNI